jgi:hypothetical protein
MTKWNPDLVRTLGNTCRRDTDLSISCQSDRLGREVQRAVTVTRAAKPCGLVGSPCADGQRFGPGSVAKQIDEEDFHQILGNSMGI